MGSGAAKGAATPREAVEADDVGLEHHVIEAAKAGNQECQDMFFEKLNAFAASGNGKGLRRLVFLWQGCTHTHGGREATCVAAKNGQAESLKVLLDLGVKPYIGRNDPVVNPLIHAVEVRSWECIELLVPRALKYNFSTRLLQEGMLEFVLVGDVDMMSNLLQVRKIPGSTKLLCAALLAGPEKSAADMTREIVGKINDLNEVSTLEPAEGELSKGWEEFAPIHAASKATKSALQPTLLEWLITKGVALSTWGKELSLKTTFAKRLPLHYAASNKGMPTRIVELMAKAYPDAMFAHVNDKPGRDLPCQSAKHNEETQQRLEELMYQHVCESFDALETDPGKEYTRLVRMALLFEQVRTLDESKLSRGKLSFVVTTLMQRKMEDWSGSSEKLSDFSTEAGRFAEANPRINLGRSTGTKIAMKSISDIGSMIKSDFWELLKLANHCQAAEIPHFKEMLNQEIQSRLKWVSSCISTDTTAKAARSDLIRYGMFVFAGLIGDVIAAKPTSEDGEDTSTKGKESSILSAVVQNVPSEYLQTIVAAYSQELHLPKAWNLLGVLEEGLTGSGIKQIVFSGGDLVVKLDVVKGSPTFEWVEGLFENTFLKRYTRDRRGGKVPESLQLEEVEQVLNCGSWGEYAKRRKQVHGEVAERGAAWTGDLRTDTCTKGEAADWFRTEEYPNGVNEHWLYHGTSLEGETGISEGDFRLNLAGSNAGTLYGNGV